ncbi:PolC-type DNA polymerase III [Streptococcus sp. DD12]|uniref:PolC-type DNA polymerase III n=1 Tax=Streptococcus sp. DD12 TaxID=1777880 RepID=UPI000795237F|nr:PolC-type DNA polymerase III [Streptococcus sp. DD12]KXT75425.1 DNA polymerase III alpha subunit [Streptococcus sp. DD12]
MAADMLQLYQQIGLPSDLRSKENFQNAEISKVIVHKKSRHWEFFFDFPNLLDAEEYRIFRGLLVETFSQLGIQTSISFNIRSSYSAQDSDVLLDYVKLFVKMTSELQRVVSGDNGADSISCQENLIQFRVPDYVDDGYYYRKYLPLINDFLVGCGFPKCDIAFVLNRELGDAQRQIVEESKQKRLKEAEVLGQEAILQSEKREKVEEASEPRPTFTFEKVEEKRSSAGLMQQTVTPMVEITDEENQVVFEGLIFDFEARTTRTGRIILSFKMTDYTSSFTMQRWVRNEEELKRFDFIKKGAWVRVRGNIEDNRFTRSLVMNVRDAVAVTHDMRKDLMPEGEKRVEFHAHTNMSAMDAIPEVEDLVKRAADWGHSAIAITDHGNVQSFPHGYHAGKKNGVKVIFGLEANIVDDQVMIAYNASDRLLDDAIYVVFDVETTGLSAVNHQLIQIAASKMQKGNIIDEFDVFINPGHPLSKFTTELTGITDNHVKDAPPIEETLKAFQEFCDGAILVAHNASFDVGFMNANYERYGLPTITQPVIDTIELARNLYPEYKRHGLGPLTKRFGVALEHHHMANFDAEATGRLLFIFLKEAKEKHKVINLNQLNFDLIREDSYQKAKPYHTTIYVQTQEGLINMFKLVSLSNVTYFSGIPRIPRSVLDAHREGLLLGTACSDGEVFDTLLLKGFDAAVEVARYYDFIEVMPPALYRPLLAQDMFEDEKGIEKTIQDLVAIGQSLDKPVLATGNVHYLDPEDAIYREIIVRSLGQGAPINRPIGKGDGAQPAPLPEAHFRTTNEMLDDFAFLGEAEARRLVITEPNALAERFDAIEVVKKDLYTPFIERAEEQVAEMTYAKAFELYGNPLPDIIDRRIEKELTSILGNGFAVIYLASQMLVNRSNARGYLVGSRGSVGSSFVATMIGITEVNPMPPHYVCPQCRTSEFITDGSVGSGYDLPNKDCPKCGTTFRKDGQDIPFETFLGFDGDKVPDIDLNFSGDDQPLAHLDVRDIFGEDYAFRAGTVSTVADRTAYGFVKGYERDFQKDYNDAEVDRLAMGAAGVKRSTGQHPGGIVVIPDYMNVYDFTPIQYPADDLEASWRTTHFNFHDIDENVLKLDILGHDDPTMVRKLQDLSGIDPKDIPADDPGVMALFSGTDILGVTAEQIGTPTGMLGIPEFGTNFVRGMVEETHPTTFAELLQLSGLSHGTDVWLGNAQDLIKEGIADLSTVIGCRDDIMVYLMHRGLEPKMAFTIMERVRKGMWLKISEDERNGYIQAMRENNVPDWYIESCGKIKYMFPKAHAAAYVLMALRVAYFKVHYPIYYYCAYFSIRAKAFDIKTMSAGLVAVKERLKEIALKQKNNEASNVEKDLYTTLEIVNEMLERGFSFGQLDLYKSDATEFLIDGDTLIPPFVALDGLGENVAKQLIRAREEGEFLSKTELRKRGGLSQTLVDKMDEMGILGGLPEDNQLSLFEDLF